MKNESVAKLAQIQQDAVAAAKGCFLKAPNQDGKYDPPYLMRHNKIWSRVRQLVPNCSIGKAQMRVATAAAVKNCGLALNDKEQLSLTEKLRARCTSALNQLAKAL